MATLELVVSEFIVLAIVCFFLIRHYKGNMVTLDVAVAVYFSWVLGFAGILLLPFDISVAVVDSRQSDTLIKVWNFIYWSTFILAWVILPMQMEYHNSGHFTFTDKLKDALRKNVWSGVLAAIAGLVYIVYMMMTSSGSLSQVIGFVKAMGNTYGILLITVLMGSGLVSLPRRMWYYADIDMELNGLYMMAASIETYYQEARYELEDCEWDVSVAAEKIRNSKNTMDSQYILILQDSVANFAFKGRSSTRNYMSRSSTDTSSTTGDTRKGLIELHARLKQSQIRARACEQRWKHLVQQCDRAEAIINDDISSEREDGTTQSPGTKKLTNITGLNNNKNYLNQCSCVIKYSISKLFNAKYVKFSCRLASVLCGVISVIILWSELVMATEMRSPVGYLMGAYSPQRAKNAVVMQAVSFLALSYMSICTYWSLFRLNLGWAYTLQGPQLSPPASLIFNGEYFSRLQFALGYNFLMFLNVPRTKSTSFDQLMSNMNMVPVFGTSFAVYIPIVMIVVALMTVLNFNTYILRLIGVESDDAYVQTGCFSSKCCRTRTEVALHDEDLERYEAGKKLVSSELRSLALSLSNSTSTSSSLKSSQSQFSHKSSLNSRNVHNTRDDNSSCLTNIEKGESPYLDEETNDSTDDDPEIEVNFSTDGRRDNGHKKSASINFIKNQIHSNLHTNTEKYSRGKHGVLSSRENSADASAVGTSATGSSNNIFSKLTDFFQLKKSNSFHESTEALSRVSSVDEREMTGAFKKGVYDIESRRVSSSSLLPLKNPRDSGSDSGVGFQQLRGGYEGQVSGIGFMKEDKKLIPPLDFQSYKDQQPSGRNHFGADEEPVAMYSGRRYVNI